MILAVDRVFDVEHRREVLAQPLAVVDGEAAVGILGHDLQRAAVLGRHLHAHERKAHVVGDGLDDARDARLEAGFLDVAFFVRVEDHVPGNKKERGRLAPTLQESQ